MAVIAPLRGQTGSVGPKPVPDILVINSYAPGYNWSEDELRGMISVIKAEHPEIEPVIEYLDFKRFPAPEREAALLADVVSKCRVRPPRVIVTLDDPAFDFAAKHRAELGGAAVPLVFGGLNLVTPERLAGQPNCTGVSEESDYSGTFALIGALVPTARRVLVVSNPATSAQASLHSFRGHARKYAAFYQFEYYTEWTSAELVERLASLPDGTVGLILDVTRDVEGRNNYNSGAFTEALATRANRPVFITSRPPGDVDWSVKPWDGIGGGLVVADVHGAKVGELVLRVLRGEPAAAIPVERHTPQRLEVNYPQLRRHGFSLKQLPPGTVVTNAPQTFYQINRSRLPWIGGAFVALVAAVVVLSVNNLRRIRAEKALRWAEEKLRSAQKMEAIGLLAGGVAHDFNNILQVIRGHASFLEDAVGGSAEARDDLAIIRESTDRAAQLTQQLLALGRRQQLRTEEIDPDVLVEGMAKMLRRVLGEHIDVQLTLLSKPCTMLADKGQLEQVLLNLCLNARDAMFSGGRIAIALERVRLEAEECEGAKERRPGEYLRLTVSDTGCGMSAEVRRRLFEPFFTTKEPGKGTGLGLAVVYGIVGQHGGSIDVYSEEGAGTSFKILLPLCAGSVEVGRVLPRDAIPRGQGKVLLAEDDPHVRRIGVRLLEQNGFQVLTAADGEAAIQLLSRHHRELRLAVLDVLMPKRNGRQVQEHIRAECPGLPVLFCSGYAAEMLPASAVPAEGCELLGKPYSREELLTRVHRLARTV